MSLIPPCFVPIYQQHHRAITVKSQSVCPIVRIGSLQPPSPQASVVPPRTQLGGDTLAMGGAPNSVEVTETLVLCVLYILLYNPFTCHTFLRFHLRFPLYFI